MGNGAKPRREWGRTQNREMRRDDSSACMEKSSETSNSTQLKCANKKTKICRSN